MRGVRCRMPLVLRTVELPLNASGCTERSGTERVGVQGSVDRGRQYQQQWRHKAGSNGIHGAPDRRQKRTSMMGAQLGLPAKRMASRKCSTYAWQLSVQNPYDRCMKTAVE